MTRSLSIHEMKSAYRKARNLYYKAASSSTLLSAFHYALINRSFDREHKAVLSGQLAYYKGLSTDQNSYPLLRRNIHRLEKGLIMRPRRKVFAEAFIGETVECYRQAVQSPSARKSELKWAHDVLNEYFGVVEIHGKIKLAYDVFTSCRTAIELKTPHNTLLPSDFKPYKHSNLPKSNITFDQIQHLFTKRRSVRWYQDKDVEIEKVTEAINIASLAPSACNRQPYRHIIIKDKDTISKVANLAGGTKGFSHNIPLLIVSIGDLSAYPYERDRHLIYIDSSLANMQLLLALQTQSIDSCSINWPDIKSKDEEISKALKLPPHERVIMLMSAGYALDDGEIPYSQKKNWEEITQII